MLARIIGLGSIWIFAKTGSNFEEIFDEVKKEAINTVDLSALSLKNGDWSEKANKIDGKTTSFICFEFNFVTKFEFF